MTGILLAAALCLFLLFIYQLSRSFILGWYSYLIVSALAAIFGLNQSSVGGLNLDPSDIISIALLFAGVIRTATRTSLPGRARLLGMFFVSLFAFSLVRGMWVNGFTTASNESRGFVGELSAILYFMSMPADEKTVKRVVKAYILYGTAMLLTAVLHYAGFNVGASSELIENAEKNRALTAASAQGLALAFFFALAWVSHRPSPAWMKWLPGLMMTFIIAVQERTVWNVTLAGILALFLVDHRMLKRLAPVVVLGGVMVAFVAVGVYGSQERAANELEDSASNTGTWEWRVNAWQQLIFAEGQTPFTVLLGQPMGTPIIQLQQGTYLYAPPHSEYVYLYLRFGVVGLITFLLFVLSPAPKLFRLAREDKLSLFPTASAWFLIVVGVLVYGVTYDFEATGIMAVGMANGLLLARRAEQTAEPAMLAYEDPVPAA